MWVDGDGPTALLVHGFPLDHRMWLDQIGPLAGVGRRIMAPDLRGHGRSGWAGDVSHSPDLFADDLAALVEVTASGPVDVVGLSMGGYAALALWERYPALVASLTLVDTRPGADTPAAREGRDEVIAGVVANGRGPLVEQMTARLLAAGAPVIVRARLRTMIEEQPFEGIVADLAGMRDRRDRTGLLARISVPTLVVVGSEDVVTPPSEAEAMASAIPDARLVVIPGAGHITPMEAPGSFNAELQAFWATVR